MSIKKKEQPSISEKKYGLSDIKEFFIGIIDLKKGVDKQGTIDEIKAKKSMSGANAWMLLCSIIIACIGLDRNSDAVIIGAMLISPLMSPILGIGLGIGINDKEVVKISFLHFAAAVFIALVTSYIYFELSPFAEDTPAIVQRTEPLTLDIIVAIFGGLAGIISIARKDISTTLPGVAIATALMPPLCVTGYGLAVGNMDYARNSFYLFILNTSFISIATYIVVRYLRFPYRRYINRKEKLRNRIIVGIFSLLIIIPSFFILNNVLEKKASLEKSKHLLATVKNFEKDHLKIHKSDYYSYEIEQTDSVPNLIIKVFGKLINSSMIPQYKEILSEKGLKNWNIEIIDLYKQDPKLLRRLEAKLTVVEKQASEGYDYYQLSKKIEFQRALSDSTKVSDVSKELKILYDDILSVSYSANTQVFDRDTSMTIPSFLISSKKKLDGDQMVKVKAFLMQRMQVRDLLIYQVPN